MIAYPIGRNRAIITGVLACLLVSCGNPGGQGGAPGTSTSPPIAREPSLHPPSKPPAGVSLTASVSADGDIVTIEYRVVNDGDEPIVVFNGVPESESTKPREPKPDAFYVIPSGADGVRLTKQVYGMPEGVTVYAPFTIGGTIVKPGDTAKERVTVGRSLTPRRPYQDVLGYGDLMAPDRIRSIDLCIGVAVASKVHPRAAADPEHPVYGHDTGTANQQYVFCSGEHRLGE